MMNLASTHPHYDLRMELVSILPKHPFEASRVDVCADLGLPNTSMLKSLVQRVNDMGIRLVKFIGERENVGRCLAIDPRDWDEAQRMADAYIDELYSDLPLRAA